MTSVSVIFEKAEKLRSLGDLPAAEELLCRIVREQPRIHQAWHSLGLIAHQCGRLDKATELIGKALELDRDRAIYHRNLGELRRLQGRHDQAIALAERAIHLAPKDADAFYNLGIALSECDRRDEAIKTYRRAIKIRPRHNFAWNNLGACLERANDKDGALKAYRKAVKIAPDHAEAQNNVGAILSERGKLDEAKSHFEAAIKAKPGFAEAHHNLSTLKTYTDDDPHLAMLEQLALSGRALSVDAQTRLMFALGKARDDVGYHRGAFVAYQNGNRQHRQTIANDEVNADRTMEAIIDTFDPAFLEQRVGLGSEDATPIFILGMPRSGTTLVEQILSSHPTVHGGGELSDFHDCVKNAAGSRDFLELGEWSDNVPPDFWKALGLSLIHI